MRYMGLEYHQIPKVTLYLKRWSASSMATRATSRFNSHDHATHQNCVYSPAVLWIGEIGETLEILHHDAASTEVTFPGSCSKSCFSSSAINTIAGASGNRGVNFRPLPILSTYIESKCTSSRPLLSFCVHGAVSAQRTEHIEPFESYRIQDRED